MKLNPSQQNALLSRIYRFYRAKDDDRKSKRVELIAYVEKLCADAYSAGFDEGLCK